MYRYDEFDYEFVRDRVNRFRDQIDKRLKGVITEDEFKPLRLQNGLYLQLHAYMLRVAVPYGSLNSEQLQQLAMIAERWDKGYGHFTTRQNIQYNWPSLENVADILDALADVGMHAMQTSGNCIRNITADHFAGAAQDEIEDPRPTAELLRQWSTDHPEFAYLPRKFKIAVTGSPNDRAVVKSHDIGIVLVKDASGEISYQVLVGGGLGRTPVVAKVLNPSLPKAHLLPYVEAILRVYNLAGRRDNKYKARIKILVKSMGIDAFREAVDAEFESILGAQASAHNHEPHITSEIDTQQVSQDVIDRIQSYFTLPEFLSPTDDDNLFTSSLSSDVKPCSGGFDQWCKQNLHPHIKDHYTIATISLKATGEAPGDASVDQMRVVANLAKTYAHNEIRISHEQNLVLPHVPKRFLRAIYNELAKHGLATANIGLISDSIACPGMDYCSLATARSIPVAKDIGQHFANPEYADSIGKIKVKISGCINACGHHHVGHIGILGLEKGGKENYQFTFGGDHTENMTIGDRAGPGIDAEEVVPALERVIQTYLNHRESDEETFLSTYRRVGMPAFKEALYQTNNEI
jgi:sulfite reductase (NADPH) hemoprotein beta-component